MLNTKYNSAKNSSSSEFLKNRWLQIHGACKYAILKFLLGQPAPATKSIFESIVSFWLITSPKSHFKIFKKYAK